jgi:RNA polymerase sigma factor (sigma-70 family)
VSDVPRLVLLPGQRVAARLGGRQGHTGSRGREGRGKRPVDVVPKSGGEHGEAFARLLANYESVREPHESVREPQAWLFRTGYRLLTDEYRWQRRVGDARPEQAAEMAEELDPELIAALATLAPNVRLCVFLRYYADLSVGEIAHLTGSTRTTVKVRLHRARAQLRLALSGVGGAHVPVD